MVCQSYHISQINLTGSNIFVLTNQDNFVKIELSGKHKHGLPSFQSCFLEASDVKVFQEDVRPGEKIIQ